MALAYNSAALKVLSQLIELGVNKILDLTNCMLRNNQFVKHFSQISDFKKNNLDQTHLINSYNLLSSLSISRSLDTNQKYACKCIKIAIGAMFSFQ